MNKLLITKSGLERVLATNSYKEGDFHQAFLDVAYDDWQRHDNELIKIVIDEDENEIWRGMSKDLDGWWNVQADTSNAVRMNDWRVKELSDQEHWGYYEMLENAKDKYGALFMALTLVGKYNQQVCNGGHSQYFYNGYASGGDGGFGSDHDPEIPLHEEMIELYEEHVMPKLEELGHGKIADTAHTLMKRFHITTEDEEECEECCGSREVEVEDDETGNITYETCGYCGGSGYVECNTGEISNQWQLDEFDKEYYKFNDEFMDAINLLCEVSLFEAGAVNARFIGAASRYFDEQFDKATNDKDYVIPAFNSESAAALSCFALKVAYKMEYGYVEECEGGWRCSRVYAMNNDLRKRVRDMSPGEQLDYWKDVADVYDEADADGNLRHDIREAYDEVLEYFVKYEHLKREEREDDDTTFYVKLAK